MLLIFFCREMAANNRNVYIFDGDHDEAIDRLKKERRMIREKTKYKLDQKPKHPIKSLEAVRFQTNML